MTDSTIALLIPAFRPTAHLETLIRKITSMDENVFSRIVIVDDGSGQEFASIFSAVALFPKVAVVKNAINLGKGGALKHGFNYVLATGHDESIVTADADGQHAPEDIIKIAAAAQSAQTSLILGVRVFDAAVPLRSRLGNQLTRYVLQFVTGLKLADTQTGLRAWPKALALQTLKIRIDGYDFELESLVKAKDLVDADVDIVQVPISTIYIDGNKSSHFNPVLDSMRIYFVFIRFCGAGLFTALVDNAVFVFTYGISGSVAGSQTLSRIAGALVSFASSRQIVFRNSGNLRIALLKFFGLVALFGFVSYGMISFLVAKIGIGVIFAKLLTELTLFLASFTIQRDFIFSKSTPAVTNDIE